MNNLVLDAVINNTNNKIKLAKEQHAVITLHCMFQLTNIIKNFKISSTRTEDLSVIEALKDSTKQLVNSINYNVKIIA